MAALLCMAPQLTCVRAAPSSTMQGRLTDTYAFRRILQTTTETSTGSSGNSTNSQVDFGFWYEDDWSGMGRIWVPVTESLLYSLAVRAAASPWIVCIHLSSIAIVA